MANLKENVLLTKDDIVSSKSIEKNIVVDTDKYGGQILKYHDIPLAALWNGLQFAVENTYEKEKQGIKILDEPIQLTSRAAVNKHIKSFLVENQVLYSSITDKSSIEQFNKSLADAATYAHCAFPMPKAERLIDAVYNLEKNEQGYIMPVSINGASVNHSYTLSLTSEDISPSRQAADIALDKFINQLQTGSNPYGQALAQRYEKTRDDIAYDFSTGYETYIRLAAENNPDIKVLVEKNLQQESAKEPTTYQQRMLDKINRETNKSQDKNKSEDINL